MNRFVRAIARCVVTPFSGSYSRIHFLFNFCLTLRRDAPSYLNFALAVLFSLVVAPAHAQLSPEVQRGLSWLQSQVQSDGSLAGETGSIATALQVRSEALNTLKLLNAPTSAIAPLQTILGNDNETNTEYLARRAWVLGASGIPQPALIDLLQQRQNIGASDGGYGGNVGYSSHALDTAFVLLAQKAGASSDTTAVANALTYLHAVKAADGSFSANHQANLYVTVKVLLAAAAWSTQTNTSDITLPAQQWLLAQRNSAQNFGNSFDNALVLWALTGQTSQSTVLQPLVEALKAEQLPDGSWNNDPYLTAIALRGLFLVTQISPAPTTAAVSGVVVDASNLSALADVTVQIIGDTLPSTTSSANGSFSFAGVSAGTLNLRLSKLGYGSKEVSIILTAGQNINMGSISLTPSSLTATLSGVVRNQSGTVLRDVTVAVGTASALTDVNGTYQITGLNPGAATITASVANYQTATAAVTFVAGTSYLFSPRLNTNGSATPSTTSLTGIVIDAVSKQALVGATVKLGTVSQTTSASGTFTFNSITAGSFVLAVAASGYQSASASGVSAVGINNVGNIGLSRLPANSTLSGVITDAVNHLPINAATVSVQGQGVPVVTGVDGKYSIAGLNGTSFTLNVSAAGYVSQAQSITLTQVGSAVVDVALHAPDVSGSDLSFINVATSNTNYPASGVIPLELVLANNATTAASVQVSAQVINAQNSVVHEYLASPVVGWMGTTYGNNPVTVAANSTLELHLDWNTLQLPAGVYGIQASALDGAGRMVAQGATSFSVMEAAHLAGGVTADPPLAQAGANTPIALAGDITNTGNVTLPEGNLQLRVTLDTPDTSEIPQVQASLQLFAPGALMQSASKLITDAQGNLYTVNFYDGKVIKIDTAGVQTILATLPPIPYAIDLAFDEQGNIWVAGQFPSKLFKITTQGAVTKIPVSSFDQIYAIDFGPNGMMFLSGTAPSGESILVQRDGAGIETVLWRNGLVGPVALVKDDANNYVVTNSRDGTLVKISAADGLIAPFVTGLSRPKGITRDTSGNFYVADAGTNTIVKVAPSGQTSVYASGLNQPFDLAFDAAGNLFVSNANDDSILKVLPTGVVQVFAKGVANGPQGMKYDTIGNLWIVNDDGSLRKKDAQDNVSTIATGLNWPRGLAIAANGDVLVVENSAGKISRISNGVKSTFATGLTSPFGVAIDPTGNVFVTEQNTNSIVRFDAAGVKLGVTESQLLNPSTLRAAANGDVYIQNTGFISVRNTSGVQIAQRNFNYGYWVPDSANGGLVALNGASVLRVSATGVVTTIKAALPFYPYGLALDTGGNIILQDFQNKKLQKLDGGGNLSELATVPTITSQASNLQSDAAGNLIIRLSTGTFNRVSSTGVLSVIPHSIPESSYGWSASGNGQFIVWGYATTYRVDATTGATSVWLATRGYYNAGQYVSGAAIDGAGNLVLSDGSGQTISVYSSSGNLLSQFDGFVKPYDLTWSGAEIRFVDGSGRLYGFTDSGYPVKKAGMLPVQYLSQYGNDTLGSASNNVYRWTGTGIGYDSYATVSGGLTGIAARMDGSLAVAVNGTSRVVVLDASKAVLKDYAGLRSPQGLAFDNAGRLYVANYAGGTIARFDSLTSPYASTFAKIDAPQNLAFDASGQLLVTKYSGVDRLSNNGIATTLGSTGGLYGVLVDGASILAIDQSRNYLRKLKMDANGNTWDVFAAGIVGPKSIRTTDNGDVFVLSQSNNTLVKYRAGKLDLVASLPTGMNVFDIGANGTMTIAGNSGMMSSVALDGTVADLRTGQLVNQWALNGVAESSNGKLYVSATNPANQTSTLFEVSVNQPVAPPPAGTVVYQTAKVIDTLPVDGSYQHVNFGTWTAPYGGDFKVEMWRDGIDGKATNFIHVGPHAQSLLTAAKADVPPGDSALSMCLDIKGADFAAISRVEMNQVRKVSASNGTFPKGMAADRVGNVYVTDATSLYRTNAAGNSILIAGGMSLAFGLATDSQQNFYVASKNGSTNRYELIRIDLQGTKAVVADLGVTAANGVQVNSQDEVLVGSPGKLLKVDKQGVVTQVTAVGLPSPRGIAVDGRDNTYVQNDNQFVSMIKPDGSGVGIFSGADGVVNPEFEGDGYPNIAADCADNFYIAPATWNKINQSGEEHSLAQVVPRTGRVALLFDTRKIDPTLGDIDYLAFDRFNNRILMWNHDAYGSIWQVPVTCGAIGVQTHLVAKPGQVFTGASKPPSAVIPQADGRTEYVWSLRDVTAQGSQVCFDAPQLGVQLGEERKTIDSGFISFQNSFAPGDVTVPLIVPLVRAANLVSLSVASDLADYPANAVAMMTTTLNNANKRAISGTLNVQVFDSHDVLVGSVTQQTVILPANGVLPIAAPFSIGTIVPAQYTVKAVLSDAGVDLARAQSVFNVLPDNIDASAKSTVATDRTQYNASGRVVINSRVVNQSTNIVLENLTVMVKVYDANGVLQWSAGHSVPQLVPGAIRDYSAIQTLQDAPEGIYTVMQTFTDSQGRVFDQPQTTYTVGSSANTGYGLAGSMVVSPKSVPVGEMLTLNASASNAGNSAFANLPLMLRIIDPVAQQVIAEYLYTANINVGANYQASNTWQASGIAGATYVAVLSATVGGKTLTLAQDSFQLAPPIPADLGISMSASTVKPVVGDTVVLTINVNNAGPGTARSAIATTILPAGLTLMSATSTVGSFDNSSGLWTLGSLASAATATLTISAKVLSVESITVNATVSTTSVDPNNANNSASVMLIPIKPLVGTIVATPKAANVDDTVLFAGAVTNQSATDLSAVPVTLIVKKMATQAVVQQWTFTPTIAHGMTFNLAQSWSTVGVSPGDYVVVLNTTSGSTTLPLAQDTFSVSAPTVQLDITQQAAPWQNVLVYSACKRAADDLLGQCGAQVLPVESAATLAQCDSARVTFLDQYLTGLGIAHKVTSSGADFLHDVRSGLYNTYWVSNGATALREPTASELQAAVLRGDGLLLDGLSASRNLQLTQCAGVIFNGKYAVADQPLSVLGPLFSANSFRITALPVQIKAAAGATAQAKLGPVAGATDGIVSGSYGQGKTLSFSFDWLDTLRTQGDSRWSAITQTSLGYLTPPVAATPFVAGEVFTLRTAIHNAGQTADLQVLQTLPPGAQIFATEPAAQIATPPTGATASWSLNVPANTDRILTLRLRVPSTAGNASIATATSTVKAGVVTPVQTRSFDFTVQSANDVLTQLIASVTAMTPATPDDAAARTAILNQLNKAKTALAANRLDQTLRQLLAVQTRMDNGISQAATLARLIEAVEWLSVK